MSTVAEFLWAGVLVLVAAGMLCLFFAVTRAPDGREDSSGFHYDSGGPAEGRARQAVVFAVDHGTETVPVTSPGYLDSIPGAVRPIPH